MAIKPDEFTPSPLQMIPPASLKETRDRKNGHQDAGAADNSLEAFLRQG